MLVAVFVGIAALAMMRVERLRPGRLWRVVGWLMHWVPTSLRRRAYQAVWACRFHLFGAPTRTCPLLPEGQTLRLLA